MHRPGNRIAPGLRSAARPHHATGPTPLAPILDGSTTGWHTAFAERLRGPLDPAALQAALGAVATRQDALRYRIVDGAGVVDPPGVVPLAVIDLTDAPPGVLDARLADLARTAFDPADGLWRAALYRLGTDDHVLAVAGHRAVFDDRTQALLYAELASAYPAATGLPPMPTTFAGYVAGRRGRSDLSWWSAHLAGVAPRLELPAAVLLAALGVVLARLTGQADFVIGSPTVGARSPASEPLIGSLAEIAPLRLRPDPATSFASHVRQARDELLEALAHPTVGPAVSDALVQVLFETV